MRAEKENYRGGGAGYANYQEKEGWVGILPGDGGLGRKKNRRNISL